MDLTAIKEMMDAQIAEAKQYKHSWLAEAMAKDPAFMLNPVEEYYKKLIPPDILESLTEEEVEDIISIYDPVTWGEKNLLRNYGGWKPRTSKHGFPLSGTTNKNQRQTYNGKSRKKIGQVGFFGCESFA